jgi:hypothetical protein
MQISLQNINSGCWEVHFGPRGRKQQEADGHCTVRSFQLFALTKYEKTDKVKNGKKETVRGAYWRNRKAYRILVRKPERRRPLRSFSVVERTILK